MKQEHQIEVELADGRILQAAVDVDFVYERNPYDKETAHYSGENDGYYIDDWDFVGDVSIDGTLTSPLVLSNKEYGLVEREVRQLSYEE